MVVEIVNTTAMRSAYTPRRVSTTRAAEGPELRRWARPSPNDNTRPPATAPQVNTMATNSSPLPRDTVAKEAVLVHAYLVPKDTHEPQEGDPGERQ